MNFFKRAGRVFRTLPRLRFWRPFAVQLDWGHDNVVAFKGRLIATVRLYGSGNRIELPETSSFVGHITVRGRGNRVLIGENCRIAGELMIKGSNQTISIGEGTTFESVYIVCLERCDVTIGRWCMFSRGIEMRTSDAHSLIRRRDGRRLNLAAPVVIGDHVWVGVGALISKGTVIPDDCVVGAKSFVNKAFSETSTLLAGTPATVVKRGITWNRGRKRRFSNDEMKAWRVEEPVTHDQA